MDVKPMQIPDRLPGELSKRKWSFRYTSPVAIYHSVWLWGATFCGVFGDGANGTYEWFYWEAKNGQWKLETSDCGYGSDSIALRDVLLKAEPVNDVVARNARAKGGC